MTFLDECKSFAGPAWERYLHHPWIEALFAGELSEERFEYWLIQDLPYLSTHIAETAYSKVPPHNPWVELQQEYKRRSGETRVELRMLERVGDFAKARWAARPWRDGLINFWIRTVYEGTFGDICCATYVCDAFSHTFGERYLRDKPAGLPDLQVEWVEQWIDPFHEKIRAATEDGINEYGAQSTDYERDKMRWLFLRATQYQIGTFDAAWNLSDAWPGEGEEIGVLAGRAVEVEA